MFSRIILLARRGALQFLAESECKGKANFYNTKLFEKKISNFFHTFLQTCYSQQVIEKKLFYTFIARLPPHSPALTKEDFQMAAEWQSKAKILIPQIFWKKFSFSFSIFFISLFRL